MFDYIYENLISFLPVLQEEANKNRWKGVKAENFKIERTSEECYLMLEYEMPNCYKFFFRMGRGEYFNFDDPYEVDVNYIFEPTSNDDELNSLLDKENNKFLTQSYPFLFSIFSHNVYFCAWDNGFQNGVELKFALQKYCLMLDVMIPLMSNYEVSQPFSINILLQYNKVLSNFISANEFQIIENSSSLYLFNQGKWI